MKTRKSFFNNFQNTIGYLLFKKIFLAYIILVSIISVYQIYKEYSFAEEIVLKNLDTTQLSFGAVLAQTVWHFDENKIVTDTKAIIDAQIVSGISILSPSDEVLVFRGLISEDMKSHNQFLFENEKDSYNFADKLLIHKFDLIDEINSPSEVLGKVHLFIEEDKILEIAKEGIYLILINTIGGAIILWFSFIYFTNKLLTIPLNQFIEATKELSLKEYKNVELSLNTNKEHELNTLLDTFNNMSKRVFESYINLKQLTIIQEKQKKDLEEANQSKNDFLANMSHELKTPLNSINVISSVMMKNKKGKLDDSQVKNITIINSCGNDLLFLINDVLDISKLEAGEVSMDLDTVNIYNIMTEIKDMFEIQIKNKNLNFDFNISDDVNLIYSDKNRIKQIVKNLLSNSLKFTNEGSIKFIVNSLDDYIQIIVTDDGIGISKDKLEHVFDRFKQADGSTTRNYGGTGLGLAISKELIILLNGDIQVKSTLGVGTSFMVKIPKKLDKINNNIINDLDASKIVKEVKELVLDKTPIQELIENEKKPKVLLLNNDPLSFFSIAVSLKKLSEFDQVDNIKQVFKELESKDYDYIILDLDDISSDNLNSLFEKYDLSLILVCDDKSKLDNNISNKVSNIFEKPINEKEFLTIIKG